VHSLFTNLKTKGRIHHIDHIIRYIPAVGR